MKETKRTNSTARQRAISSARLAEIIDICKEKGVEYIKIDGMVEFRIFPFAVNLGAVPMPEKSSSVETGGNLGHNDDETDMDLLLHSAR